MLGGKAEGVWRRRPSMAHSFIAATDDGNKISVNIPTVGRVPNGATVERLRSLGYLP